MFVSVNAHPGSKPKPLGQLGELSRARVIPSEFKYNRGTEIFGETEPADNLRHAEDHMLLLGRTTSLERVAAFLLEMDPRLTAAGVMAPPMSRRDIADYLGLTLETVSRALSHLHGMGILGFLGQTQRQIVLLDRVGLAELNLCEARSFQ
jgi:hypothetical protein